MKVRGYIVYQRVKFNGDRLNFVGKGKLRVTVSFVKEFLP